MKIFNIARGSLFMISVEILMLLHSNIINKKKLSEKKRD